MFNINLGSDALLLLERKAISSLAFFLNKTVLLPPDMTCE